MEGNFDKAFFRLLEVKDSDIRLLTLRQCADAVDRGIHIGGAFSAVIPLVSLFYGGNIELDIEDPTAVAQDKFVMSKGHAVASMASIFADLGYFSRDTLANSRSYASILNGHPGPILPGVHISTGPLGQGVGVAEGFALAGKSSPHFDVYAMTGDGELQEGVVWESVMYAAHKNLDNLCLLVDANGGQLDRTTGMVLPMGDLAAKFEAFGWRAVSVDATQYGPVWRAVAGFKHGERDGRPTAIICRGVKGFGGFSAFMNGHKVTLNEAMTAQETDLQEKRRAARVADLARAVAKLTDDEREQLTDAAEAMSLSLGFEGGGLVRAEATVGAVRTKRAPVRDKRLSYDEAALPRLDGAKEYAGSWVLTEAMKVLARDPRVVSVDSDLSSTSGLEAGVAHVDVARGLNVGIAEANMMNVGEAFAALGYNAWVSTFCPFFDWKVLRRICIGYQERLEAIGSADGWLAEGHGLDLTFVATAANLDTKTNGATHMGNDDITLFGRLAHLKIIDVSCPRQLLAIVRWIAEGNRGLIYLRIMRDGSAVLYPEGFAFEYGRGYALMESAADRAVILTSGRQAHEALATAKLLAKDGIAVGVTDMPSVDEDMLLSLYDSGKALVVAEQNNGYLLENLLRVLHKAGRTVESARILAVNTTGESLTPHYIHSGTYSELTEAYRLSPKLLAERIRGIV